MSQHDIEITIHPGGKMEAEVHGIKGTGCKKILEMLKNLGRILSDKPTKEFYEREGQVQIIRR